MLTIDQSLLIGRGKFRTCYVHPNDDSKCIKVTVKGDPGISRKELKEYSRIRSKNRSGLIATIYGLEITDLGEGLVCELIRDYTGDISRNFGDYLNQTEDPVTIAHLKKSFFNLKNFIFNELILMRDLNAPNLLFQRVSETESRLIIIDGFGNSDFIPIANYFPFWAGKKISRKWERFERYLHKFYGQTVAYQAIFDIK